MVIITAAPISEPKKEVWRIILWEIDRETGAKSVRDIMEHDFYETSEKTGIRYKKTMRRRAFEWIADFLDAQDVERQDEYSIERPDQEIR